VARRARLAIRLEVLILVGSDLTVLAVALALGTPGSERADSGDFFVLEGVAAIVSEVTLDAGGLAFEVLLVSFFASLTFFEGTVVPSAGRAYLGWAFVVSASVADGALGALEGLAQRVSAGLAVLISCALFAKRARVAVFTFPPSLI